LLFRFLCLLRLLLPPGSTLFPYTTLFRSRNGVKATVNAFDGSVTLYTWDTEDPILAAWGEVFADALQPATDISSELMSHLRYPRSEEHTSELQSRFDLVCRLLLEKKKYET